MKKAISTALLLLAMAVTVTPGQVAPQPAQAASAGEEIFEGGDIGITLFGQPFYGERSPALVDGTTLVPLRGIAEALGTEVIWDDGSQSVTLRKEASEIRLTVGSPDAVKNGQPYRLETAPRLVGETTMVPLRFIGEAFDTLVTWNGGSRTVAIDHLQSLPAVGSYDNLKTILEKAGSMAGREAVMAGTSVTMDSSATVTNKSAASSEAARAPVPLAGQEAKANPDYSLTNTQVEGVDEADIVKTDGTYLYQVNKDRVVVAQAVPADAMKAASVIDFADTSFRPQELYVDDRYLVVIGSTSRSYSGGGEPVPLSVPGNGASGSAQIKIMPVRPAATTVKAILYDIADKTAPKQVREVELDGNYVSSRKIGSALYLVTNKYAGYGYIAAATDAAAADEAKSNAPVYRDSAVSGESIPLDYNDIRYFPDSPEANYMLVAGLNLDATEQPADVAAYLGSGQNVYASGDNLYVAVGKTKPIAAEPPNTPASDTGAAAVPGSDAMTMKSRIAPAPAYETSTVVYKFRLEQGKTKFVTQGEVPGTVLNQYSMDEHNSILRIATMTGEMWRTDENTSKNNVYTLDEALRPLGRLEGIAPGERIYSVRFMGNRAYMVTFKKTDPLFAIDLTDPAAPAVLGALKIPGYSDYLHPYDETHLIGFGKETTEVPLKGDPSDPNRTIAYYQGMKLSLFDVSDVTHPVELFKETIGDRGTESELLRDPKALLFSKERHLLAFPVTVMKLPDKTNGSDANAVSAYGQFAFQGAYIYDLDLTNGFRLQTTITHMTPEQLLKAGNGAYGGGDRNVERIVYIGDSLYTLSKGLIRANDLTTLAETGSLTIP